MIARAAAAKGFLNEFLPTPPELCVEGASTYGGENAERNDAIREANLKKFGAGNWYDWQVANWGTKWDIELENVELEDEHTLTASFDSAWSPPIGAYQKLTELGFDITAYYHEPGMGFVGKFANGEDEYIEYAGATADTVRSIVGAELDDYFGLSEELYEMQQYNEEN